MVVYSSLCVLSSLIIGTVGAQAPAINDQAYAHTHDYELDDEELYYNDILFDEEPLDDLSEVADEVTQWTTVQLATTVTPSQTHTKQTTVYYTPQRVPTPDANLASDARIVEPSTAPSAHFPPIPHRQVPNYSASAEKVAAKAAFKPVQDLADLNNAQAHPQASSSPTTTKTKSAAMRQKKDKIFTTGTLANTPTPSPHRMRQVVITRPAHPPHIARARSPVTVTTTIMAGGPMDIEEVNAINLQRAKERAKSQPRDSVNVRAKDFKLMPVKLAADDSLQNDYTQDDLDNQFDGSDGASIDGPDGSSMDGSDGSSSNGSDGSSSNGSDGSSSNGSDGSSSNGSDGSSNNGSDGSSNNGSDGSSSNGSDGSSSNGSDGSSSNGSDGSSSNGSDGSSNNGSSGNSSSTSSSGVPQCPSSTTSACPKPDPTPICSTPEPTPICSTPEPTPECPTPEPTPECPTPEPTPECPVEDDTPDCPVEDDTPDCPVEDDTPDCDVEDDTPDCPVEDDTPDCPVEDDTPDDCASPPPTCGCGGPTMLDVGGCGCGNFEHQYGDDAIDFVLDTKDHIRDRISHAKDGTKAALSHFSPKHLHERVHQVLHDDRPEKSDQHHALHDSKGRVARRRQYTTYERHREAKEAKRARVLKAAACDPCAAPVEEDECDPNPKIVRTRHQRPKKAACNVCQASVALPPPVKALKPKKDTCPLAPKKDTCSTPPPVKAVKPKKDTCPLAPKKDTCSTPPPVKAVKPKKDACTAPPKKESCNLCSPPQKTKKTTCAAPPQKVVKPKKAPKKASKKDTCGCAPPPPPPACGCGGPTMLDVGGCGCGNFEHQYGDDTMDFILDTKDHVRGWWGNTKLRAKQILSHASPSHIHSRVSQLLRDRRPAHSDQHADLHDRKGRSPSRRDRDCGC